MVFNNQYISPSNIYANDDLTFLLILLGKEYSFHPQNIGNYLVILWVMNKQLNLSN